MKDLRDLKDWTIHDVQTESDEYVRTAAERGEAHRGPGRGLRRGLRALQVMPLLNLPPSDPTGKEFQSKTFR